MTSESGSFWETFGGANGTTTASGVLKRLEELQGANDTTVDTLLGEEDLIQEYRDPSNTQLREWLCQEEVLAQCLVIVLTEPPPDSSHDRAHKYPFVVSELLACDADDLVSAIAHSNAALTLFFDFLYNAPPTGEETDIPAIQKNGEESSASPSFRAADGSTKSYSSCTNPVLAGYFSRIAMRLLQEYPEEVGNFLRPRSDELLGICVRRLRSRSILDFFVKLTDNIFCVDKALVMELLAHFDHDGQAVDIAMAIDEILQHERTPRDFTALKHIASAEVIKFLCTRMLFAERDEQQIVAAIRILGSVVLHCNEPEQDEARTTDQAPSAAVWDTAQGSAPPRLFDKQRECWESFTSTLEDHLSPIACSLDAHSKHFLQKVPTANGLQHPVGTGALELISLFSTISTSYLCQASLLDAIARSKIVTVGLRMFFDYGWNTLLHNAVKQLFLRCIHDSAVSDDVVSDIIAESDFECRTAEAVANPREGNFAHMICMISEVQQMSSRRGEGNVTWQGGENWSEIVMPKLQWYFEVTSGDLGGPPPQMGHTPTSQTVCDGEDIDNFDSGGSLIARPPSGTAMVSVPGISGDERISSGSAGSDSSKQWEKVIPPVPEAPPPPPPAETDNSRSTSAEDDVLRQSFQGSDFFGATDAFATFDDSPPARGTLSSSGSSSSDSIGGDYGRRQKSKSSVAVDPFSASFASGFTTDDPFADFPGCGSGNDPFAVSGADPFGEKGVDPFATSGADPFGEKDGDPFAASVDPFGEKGADPFTTSGVDLFGEKDGDPFAASSVDPFGEKDGDSFAASGVDPFGEKGT